MSDSRMTDGANETALIAQSIFDEHKNSINDHRLSCESGSTGPDGEPIDRPAPRKKVTRREVLNIIALIKIQKALDIDSQSVAKDELGCDSFRIATFRIGKTIHVGRSKSKCANPKPNYNGYVLTPGGWVNVQESFPYHPQGNDIISLLTTISSHSYLEECFSKRDYYEGDHIEMLTAKTSQNASDLKSIADILKRFDLKKIDSQSIKQWHYRNGWHQVISPPSDSRPCIPDEMGEDSYDHWAGFRIDGIPYIGPPHDIFEIKNIEGRINQVIGCWKTMWGEPLLLSFTLWEKDIYPKTQNWFFLRPNHSIKMCPYGLDRALELRDARVVIDDDIIETRDVNLKFSKLMNPRDVMVAWPRQLYGASPDKIDWSGLKGREIVCAVGNDNDSFRHAISLYKQLDSAEAKSIKFMLQGKLPGGHQAIRVSYDTGEVIGEGISFKELIEIAKSRGISVSDDEKIRSNGWQLGDVPLATNAGKYLIEPFLGEGTIALLYGLPGPGKSFLALLLGYIVAMGRRFQNSTWVAPSPCNVLYICGERVPEMTQRLTDIHETLNYAAVECKIDIYPKVACNINLEEQGAWDSMGDLLTNAKFVIIDHLTNLTHKDAISSSWEKFNQHLERLHNLKKTVLVLHHTDKAGDDIAGTRDILKNVDFTFRIDQLPKIANGAKITFGKHRIEKGLARKLLPVTLKWDTNEKTGHYIWKFKEEAEASDRKWEPLTDEPNGFLRKINEEYISSEYMDWDAKIILSLAQNGYADITGKKVSEIAEEFRRSDETIRKPMKKLQGAGVVVDGGPARFRLADATKEKVFHL